MTWNEEWIEEVNSVVSLPEIDLTGWPSIEDWMIHNNHLICDIIAGAIDLALAESWDKAPAFTIKGSDAIILIDRSEFKHKLNTCLEYYTIVEEYESCTEILNLLKSIS